MKRLSRLTTAESIIPQEWTERLDFLIKEMTEFGGPLDLDDPIRKKVIQAWDYLLQAKEQLL